MSMKIPFFRLGEWVHPVYGKLKITQATFDQLLANFKANVLGKPPFIRIGHDQPGRQVFGDAPAEGWVQDIQQDGDVLFAVVEPTSAEAAENIKSKRYRFASAEYSADGTNRETGKKVGALLSAIALTNEPFLTKLPEATLLAAPPDTFYLDFSEGDENNMPMKKIEDGINKLSESLAAFMAGLKPAGNPTPPTTDETALKLAAFEQKFAGMESKMTALATENEQLKSRIGTETGARLLAETERQATEMVAAGIPPVQVDAWKTLALSENGQATIKLSETRDGKTTEREVSHAAAMKEMLLALPKNQRIQMGQHGSTATAPDGVKLAETCKEDILSMGGEVTADGKFKI